MPSTWHAWPRGTDPHELRRSVAVARERFLTSGHTPHRLRGLVRESWQRCVLNGVDPDIAFPGVELAEDDLREYRGSHPLSRVMPLIRRLLVNATQDSPHIVALGDATGRLLWVEGDHALRSQAERMHFVEGANWREQTAGTNAPGVALALNHEVQIFATEHFARNVQPWSCAAVPVRDPDTGEVLGVLDLTGEDTVASPHALALVRATAAAAEAELRVQRMNGVLPPIPAPLCEEGPAAPARAHLRVLGRNEALLGVDGRTLRLSGRHSEILLLLARHPEGLSGDGLGVRLHERDASAVTVRAEMSRLRRLLGDGVLTSRPYRLLTAVTTDVDDVRRHLADGDYRRALAGYTGPVLPNSEAPEVIDARHELDCEIHAALTQNADAEVLLTWAERPDGREDPRVLEAALHALPAGSPRRELVRARLERIAW
ncbi:helix-turn-helix domain-containing protein [Allosalinactinospora lopnorensis]|uniref:helix-turn-helix domain-containing protein n=1 Tax=Allosalinactinospora lopnorensis TaxID=1352348 RepID=UPI000623CB9A|nr:helix-turn-helix domain-containing protein [Allosalinactinospora lopnorensis]